MTNAQIFKAAHEIARNLTGDYRACFKMALAIVRDQKKHIQFVKNVILDVNRHYGKMDVTGDVYEGYRIACTVGRYTNGFASDVALSVDRYMKASEKQAYVIARAYVEQGCESAIFEAWMNARKAA